jgi:hypothetical protein
MEWERDNGMSNDPNGDDRKVVISKIEKKSERVRYICKVITFCKDMNDACFLILQISFIFFKWFSKLKVPFTCWWN